MDNVTFGSEARNMQPSKEFLFSGDIQKVCKSLKDGNQLFTVLQRKPSFGFKGPKKDSKEPKEEGLIGSGAQTPSFRGIFFLRARFCFKIIPMLLNGFMSYSINVFVCLDMTYSLSSYTAFWEQLKASTEII